MLNAFITIGILSGPKFLSFACFLQELCDLQKALKAKCEEKESIPGLVLEKPTEIGMA
jgi:hypothetical protein